MSQQQNHVSSRGEQKGLLPLRHWALPLLFLATFSAAAGFQVARFKSGRLHLENRAPVRAASYSSSSAPVSEAREAEYAELSRLSPQQQAERLLERAIHHQEESLRLIPQYVERWRGRLRETDLLFDLVLSALKSDDLSVRTAAVEIDLAANNLSKSPQSVARLVEQIRKDPANRPLALWRLGALGNRGTEPQTVLATLLSYVRDRNENTRYWAVEGLAMLGTDDTLDALLDRFAHDASSRVRERAACSLAKSGMFTKEQRLATVPELLNFLDDDSLDSATRGWVYAALRVITGAALGNDANAWRNWWMHHDEARKPASRPAGTLLA
ncbi:MAG: HEAT repeat domain-containing protein [Candidatus Acidiferrales bacterium]